MPIKLTLWEWWWTVWWTDWVLNPCSVHQTIWISIGTLLNFDGDCDGHVDGDGTCKQALSVLLLRYIFVWEYCFWKGYEVSLAVSELFSRCCWIFNTLNGCELKCWLVLQTKIWLRNHNRHNSNSCLTLCWKKYNTNKCSWACCGAIRWN